MQDGMFVFDNVIHMYDNMPRNIGHEKTSIMLGAITGAGKKFSIPPQYPYKEDFATTEMTVEEAYRRLFVESNTDMVVAQTVPVFGWFNNGFSPAKLNYEFAKTHPERVVFCGGVDPIFHGLASIYELERQIVEWNAKSFKFYQTQKGPISWRADDRLLAYPLYEKCLELGVTNVQFHKGMPFGPQQPLEPLRCHDIEQAALDFPDMTFVLHHLGEPYIDETINIAARHHNIQLALSAWINMHPIWPMESLHRLGKLLFWVGADRLLYGSEAFVWPSVQPYIELFANLEMPEELQVGYGYPALTREMKSKILGENQAKLLGIDIEAKKREFAATASAAA